MSGNDNPSLAKECLAFIQALVNQEIGFNFQLTSGSFSCSFDNNGKRTMTSARTPTEVKHKSPSTRKRNARRRQQFLENKKFGHSSVDCEQPDHTRYIEDQKFFLGQVSRLKFFTVDPYKVLKWAHLGIFRHEGGSVGPEKIPTSKYSGSWTIIPKITRFGPPGASE